VFEGVFIPGILVAADVLDVYDVLGRDTVDLLQYENIELGVFCNYRGIVPRYMVEVIL